MDFSTANEAFCYPGIEYPSADGERFTHGTLESFENGCRGESCQEVDDDRQAMLRNHPDAFEAFFNRFSGKTLQPHSKRILWAAWDPESEDWKSQIVLTIAVRHAKSFVFGVWFPIWLICRDRNIQVLLISRTHAQAMKHFRLVAWNLEYNEDLIATYGEFRDPEKSLPWRPGNGELTVFGRDMLQQTGDLTFVAKGAGEGVLGLEANHIIMDDIADLDNSLTEDRRDKLLEYVQVEVLTRLEPEGKVWDIGNRIGPRDVHQSLIDLRDSDAEDDPDAPRLWQHISFPALSDPLTGEASMAPDAVPLWEEKWPRHKLNARLRQMGSIRFQTIYQQIPQAPGATLWRHDWIYGRENDPRHDAGCLDRLRVAGPWSKPYDYVRAIGYDPSGGKGYAALVVADILSTATEFRMVILEIVSDRYGTRDILAQLERLAIKYRDSGSPIQFFVPEWNALKAAEQSIDFDSWRARYGVRIHNWWTNQSKNDAAWGVLGLDVDAELGRIRFPYGDGEARQQSALLIREGLSYPHGDTTDVLMATWILKAASRFLRPAMPSEEMVGGGWKVPDFAEMGWVG